jgi:glutaminyl-peptide cyclotransferase
MWRWIVFVLLIDVNQRSSIFARKQKYGITKHLVAETIPHDNDCFTQGLTFNDGFLYESCGLYGKSSIRKVDPATGQVVRMLKLANDVFAEGIVVIGETIYVLTWTNKYMLVVDKKTMTLLGKYSYITHTGEGWGLTYDGTSFIISDGSSRLSYFDVPDISKSPSNKLIDSALKKTNEINIYRNGVEVVHINDLEWIGNNTLYANIWYQDYILKIDVDSETVTEFLDLHSLYPLNLRLKSADCLNGIARNTSDGTLLLTGKLWPRYYKVNVVSMETYKKTHSRPHRSHFLNGSRKAHQDL